jgi:RNA polymerase sigma-70 factor (ECF subfamily)
MGVARDRRRKAHVRRELLDPNVFDSVADPAPDATQELERRDDLALFDSALDGLDLDQRAVFALFELEGMSGHDIATTLQIPLGTVYSRLRLARIAFRSNLKRHAARAQWQRLQVGERT